MVLAHDVSDREGVAKRTSDIVTDTDVSFESMLLAPRTLAGLSAAGFSRPSPVQLQGIPTGKCGFNLLLEAKSGTGKTAVFTVIALDMLNEQPDAEIMMLAPTREIAAQITEVIRQIGNQYKDLIVEVVMGGLPLHEDIEKFANKRKVNVIVGSPGRLRHLIEEHHISTKSVRLFVLDEADKLMESAFKPDVNYIFTSLPKSKQIIMSSATYPESLRELVNKYMSKYIHVCPNSTSVLLGIEQRLTVVKQHDNIVVQTQNRYKELLKIFISRQFKQCLIFCNFQARVVEVCKMLTKDKWPAQFLHGKQDQSDRLDTLKTLQDYKCRILVSTDLAARGIDASNVDLVINFEVPYDWTTYLHRIGRAGRYGSYGMAITIVAQGKEETNFKNLLKEIGSPINMKYLWSEENGGKSDVKMNGDHRQSSKENHPVMNGIKAESNNIWNFLISEDVKNENEKSVIEDFTNLNASYDNAGVIERFNNLLTSFKLSDDEHNDIPFKTISLTVPRISSEYCAARIEDTQSGSTVDTEPILNNVNLANKELNVSGLKKHDMVHVNGESSKSHAEVSNQNVEIGAANFTISSRHQHLIQNSEKILNVFEQEHMDGESSNSHKVLLNQPKTHITLKPKSSNRKSHCIDKNDEHSSGNNFENHEKDASECEDNDVDKYLKIFGINIEHASQLESEQESSPESDYSSESTESSEESETDSSDSQEEPHRVARKLEKYTYKAYMMNAAKSYRLWKHHLAARRAQLQTMFYIQELAKINKR